MSPDGPLLKVKRGVVLTIIGFQLIATSTSPYLPKMNARIIDEGAVVGDTSAIWPLGSITLVFALIQGVFPRFYHCFATQLTMGLEHVLRRRQFAHDQTLPSSHLSLFGLPSLTTRNTNPVQQVHMIAMMTMTIMVTAPTMAVGGIVMALRQDTTVSQLLLVVAPPAPKASFTTRWKNSRKCEPHSSPPTRLATIRNADTILVLKNGDVVEQGNAAELLKVNGAYAHLYQAQFARQRAVELSLAFPLGWQ